jgi:hypothetical protein
MSEFKYDHGLNHWKSQRALHEFRNALNAIANESCGLPHLTSELIESIFELATDALDWEKSELEAEYLAYRDEMLNAIDMTKTHEGKRFRPEDFEL